MEIKINRLLLVLLFTLLFLAVPAQAEDKVICENGRVETGKEARDLTGWGEEKLTKCVFETDVQFKETGSGFTLYNSDNTKGGTSIRAVERNGKMTLAADGGTGSYFIYYIELDPSKWYHIKLIGTYGVQNGIVDMVVDVYDEKMQITETKNYYLILMNQMYASSGAGPEHIRIEPNTIADKIKVTELIPDSIKLSPVSDTVTAGSRVDVAAKLYRGESVLDYDMPITYSVNGNGVSIDENGILTVNETAPTGSFTVKAECGDMTDILEMSVVSSDVFTINTAVFSEDGRTLEAVKAVKNYFYDVETAFAAVVYDNEGILKDCFVKYIPAKAVKTGVESDIAMDYILPDDFDESAWNIEIYAWGASEASNVQKPQGDVAVRSFYDQNEGAVLWIGEHKAIAGMLNGKTTFMQIGNNDVFVDGRKITLSVAPYIKDDITYVNSELIYILAD